MNIACIRIVFASFVIVEKASILEHSVNIPSTFYLYSRKNAFSSQHSDIKSNPAAILKANFFFRFAQLLQKVFFLMTSFT